MCTLLVSLLWGSPSGLCLLRLEFQAGHQAYLAFVWVSGDLNVGPHTCSASALAAKFVTSNPQRGFLKPSSHNGFTVLLLSLCAPPALGGLG